MIQEDLTYSDYTLFEERDSQIDHGKILKVEIGLTCPHCSKKLETIGQNHTNECIFCGLILTRHGNLLTCTLK